MTAGPVLTERVLCEHFGICGGCSRQDVPYETQIADKEARVKAALAALDVERWHSILPSEQTFFYRNKMEYSFGDRRDIEILSRPGGGGRGTPSPIISDGENQAHLGLHPKGRFAIVTPTPRCLLLSEPSQIILAAVSAWATEEKVPVFVRKSAEGDLRHLVIREGKNTGERLVNLISRAKTPAVPKLAERLKASGAPITTFIWSAYDGASDVAAADATTVFWGNGAIRERLGRISFTVTPNTFMQTNTAAAERLLDILRLWSAEDAAGGPRRALIDLYCGSGAIGLNLAPLFDEVIGVELNKDAVRDARRTAEENGVRNVRLIEGRAEEAASQLPLSDGATVVVDPPRAGLHPAMTATLLQWKAPRLYYVSCNPDTLARDLQALSAPYRIRDVQPIDFFPHTDHVETAVRLTLR